MTMRPTMPSRMPLFLVTLFSAVLLGPLSAQSPNTASLTVVVVDQNGGVLKDAKISVRNTATGAARESVSGTDGSATTAALPLTGTYTVMVSKQGFGDKQVNGIALRSGE